MAFTEDLSVFFDTADHAVEALINGRSVSVILDDDFYVVEGIASSRPLAMCRTSDVANVKRGAPCFIGSDNYKIVNIMPDGTGVTTLQLQKQ